jgi:hypothetical protein
MDVNARTIGNEPPVKRANQAAPQPVPTQSHFLPCFLLPDSVSKFEK